MNTTAVVEGFPKPNAALRKVLNGYKANDQVMIFPDGVLIFTSQYVNLAGKSIAVRTCRPVRCSIRMEGWDAEKHEVMESFYVTLDDPRLLLDGLDNVTAFYHNNRLMRDVDYRFDHLQMFTKSGVPIDLIGGTWAFPANLSFQINNSGTTFEDRLRSARLDDRVPVIGEI